MVLPIRDELLLAWRALGGETQEAGWSRILLTTKASVRLMVGRLQPGNLEALLLCFPSLPQPKPSHLPQGRGFSTCNEVFDGEPGCWLSIVRKPQGPLDLFTLMAADIVAAVKESGTSVESRVFQFLMARIRAWQHFMKSGHEGLSLEEELGLAGEIACLKELIEAGLPPEVAVEAWVGPEDGIQDFEIGSGAIEVKSTLSEAGFPARIMSLEQLDDAVRKPLFVAGCRFGLGNGGASLPERVDALRAVLIDAAAAGERFELMLLKAGYLDNHVGKYTRQFTGPEFKIWLVDDAFPRLTPSSVPVAIRAATYEIELEHAEHVIESLTVALNMIEGC